MGDRHLRKEAQKVMNLHPEKWEPGSHKESKVTSIRDSVKAIKEVFKKGK